MGINTLPMINRSTPVQLLHNKLTNYIRLTGNNRKILIQLHPLNRLINQQRLSHKPQHRTKPRSKIKHHKRNNNNRTIHQKQCTRNIHSRILLNNHRHNIRATTRSILKKQQRRSQRRQNDRKTKLQHNIPGQSLIHWKNLLKHIQKQRRNNRNISRLHSKIPSKNNKPNHQQNKINHQVDLSRRHRNKMRKYNRHTRNTTKGKIIRELKHINPHIHQNNSKCDNDILHHTLWYQIFH